MTEAEYQRSVLDNGIRVVTESMPNLKSVSIGIWVEVGSRDESPRENGISHFIEHMCFKGTRRRTARDIAQSLESLGGALNAFTSRELTCFHCRVIDEHFDLGFDVLSDIVTESLFDETELEREKEVICEEIKDVFDTPAELVHDYFAAAVWNSHPLGQTIMGDAERIKQLQRQDLLDYIGRHYTTNRIVVAAAGAVEHNQLVELTRQKLCVGEPRAGKTLMSPSYVRGEHKVYQRQNLKQTHICLGFPSIPFVDHSRYAVLILNALLGSGMSSRLFQTVREQRGLVYTIYSYHDFYHDTGLFGIYLGTDANKAAEALKVIANELAAVRDTSLTEEEVERAKSQLKGSLMLSLEGSFNRMNRLARHEIFLNRFVTLDETAAEIDALTLEDIRAAARRIFNEQLLTVVALGPVQEGLPQQIDWTVLRG